MEGLDDTINAVDLPNGSNQEDCNARKIVDPAILIAIENRKKDWLSDNNQKWALGKRREEIFEHFGNNPEPVAYIRDHNLNVFGLSDNDMADQLVYSGKGYFIDHSVNHHASVTAEKYKYIQSVLDYPDHIKRMNVDGKESIVFIKKLKRWNAISIQREDTPNGSRLWYKNFFEQKKEPYKSLTDIQLS